MRRTAMTRTERIWKRRGEGGWRTDQDEQKPHVEGGIPIVDHHVVDHYYGGSKLT